MPNRKRHKPRCWECGLKPDNCACDLLPSLRVQTPLRVVQHVGERWKPTNTIRLLTKVLPDVRVLPYGMRTPAFDPTPLRTENTEFYSLFLRDDAIPIDELPPPAPGVQRGFVVVDGTWHQCSRMVRRAPGLSELPRVKLPGGLPSIWRVRTQHDPRGVSSFEAVVRLLATVESAGIARQMMQAFELVTARLLFLKGKLPAPEVPDDWEQALGNDVQDRANEGRVK